MIGGDQLLKERIKNNTLLRERLKQYDPRDLAQRPFSWIEERMDSDPILFTLWEVVVTAEALTLGPYISKMFYKYFATQTGLRNNSFEIAPTILGMYISCCPFCKQQSVILTQADPDIIVAQPSLLKTIVKNVSHRALRDCQHPIPIDAGSQRIVDNYLYILKNLKP